MDANARVLDATYPVGATEIAEKLGVKAQTVHTWKHRGLLPEPRWVVSGQPAWEWSEIEAWARRTGRLRESVAHAELLELEGSGWGDEVDRVPTGRVDEL